MAVDEYAEGGTETGSQVCALLDCCSLTQVQGACQELSVGCAEIEMSRERESGAFGDAGLKSEETLGLEVYIREYQRPWACGHGCMHLERELTEEESLGPALRSNSI